MSSPGRSSSRPKCEAAVEVELRAGAARPGRPGLPEVVLAAEVDDPLVGDADRIPDRDRLLVGPEAELVVAAEHGDPDVVRVEAVALRRELPRELRRALLEVVAEGEVAEHLEERQVASGQADVLDVGRAEDLLARGQARVRRLLVTPEIGLERLHSGGREQHGRIEARRDERAPTARAGGRAPRRTQETSHGSRRLSRGPVYERKASIPACSFGWTNVRKRRKFAGTFIRARRMGERWTRLWHWWALAANGTRTRFRHVSSSRRRDGCRLRCSRRR